MTTDTHRIPAVSVFIGGHLCSSVVSRIMLNVLRVCLLLLAAAPAGALTQADIDAVAGKATRGLKRVTGTLASNELRGRDNDTPESQIVQRYLVGHLRLRGAGLNGAASGADAYKQPFVEAGQRGANLLAVVRGRELPDEYVIVGAHFDHLDTRGDATGHCRSGGTPGGGVCNGATDNAAGVAAVLAIGQALDALPEPPRRSVVLALWDAEEDGLLGSRYYVNHPLVPLEQTVAYVNFDIQGANLLPSLRNSTFAVAGETGGAALRAVVDAAVGAQTLVVHPFSFIFGQARSDYANFVGNSVPTIFFSDSTGGCYHTTGDDLRVVDFGKLAQQSAIGFRTVVGLAEAPSRPPFVPGAPLAVFEDAVSLQSVMAMAIPADLELISPDDQAVVLATQARIDQIVADGPAQFDNDDIIELLNAASMLINVLTGMPCQAF
jgi:hypothetical protein